MINKLELDFTTIRIYKNLIVSECHEGTLLDVHKNRKVLEFAGEVFNNAPFGYISNRINSYAVDPLVYREAAAHPQLKAIAVVSNSEIARKSAQLEQQFYRNRNPFKIFESLEEAIVWTDAVIDNHSKEIFSKL